MKSRRVSLDRVANLTLALVAAGAIASAWSGAADALSVGLGGGFMLGNFYLIRMLVSRLMRPGSEPGARHWAVAALMLKSILAVLLVAGAVYQFPVAPLSFAAGASMLLVAAVLQAVFLGEPVSGPADAET